MFDKLLRMPRFNAINNLIWYACIIALMVMLSVLTSNNNVTKPCMACYAPCTIEGGK